MSLIFILSTPSFVLDEVDIIHVNDLGIAFSGLLLSLLVMLIILFSQ